MPDFDLSKEKLAEAAEARAEGHVAHARRAGVIIAALAACLAICETAAKSAQTAVLVHHITASDTWTQYQGKSVRRQVLGTTANVLASLPNAAEEPVAGRIAEAQANATRMQSEPGRDGMEQLAARAHEQEHEREHEQHRHHGLEIASGGLQIAIVLVSVSVVTGLVGFLFGGAALGTVAVLYALLVQAALV